MYACVSPEPIGAAAMARIWLTSAYLYLLHCGERKNVIGNPRKLRIIRSRPENIVSVALIVGASLRRLFCPS